MTGIGNRRALVTGGSSGIGRGIVTRLLADGFEVVNLDLDPPPQGVAAKERHVGVDLADGRATQQALDLALGDGPILNLVNNVGINRVAAIEEIDPDDLDALCAVNLKSAVRCTQALLPGMKQAGYGRIVGLSSRVVLGRAGRSLYGATKAGMIALCRTWALELAPFGITVNVVAPGTVDTPLLERNNPAGSERRRRLEASIPVGRLGQPEDVAQAAAFFLDARSGYATGQVLYICGGMSVGAGGI